MGTPPEWSQLDDAELVRRANRGDDGAFAQLYRRHRDFAVRVALRLTGDTDLAADAVQDAFLWWLGRFPGFELRSTVKTFLYTIVRSRCIDLARRRGRTLRWSELEHEPPARSLAATLRGASDRGEALDSQRALIVALDRLPVVQQEALLLRFGHEMTDEQVADAAGVPLGTAKGRLRLGLAALRHHLGKSVDAPSESGS